MPRHFHEELDALKQTILAMGGLVEDQIRRVMRALIERDGDVAQEVIDRDRQVNAYDVEIDEKCVELLALHQPAAGDLRFITTAMKIVTDLERIGDQAVNIAQRALELNREPQLKPYIDLPRMAEKSQRMVKESLDAFVTRDTELARRGPCAGAPCVRSPARRTSDSSTSAPARRRSRRGRAPRLGARGASPRRRGRRLPSRGRARAASARRRPGAGARSRTRGRRCR